MARSDGEPSMTKVFVDESVLEYRWGMAKIVCEVIKSKYIAV
jgi:hypothetical protein